MGNFARVGDKEKTHRAHLERYGIHVLRFNTVGNFAPFKKLLEAMTDNVFKHLKMHVLILAFLPLCATLFALSCHNVVKKIWQPVKTCTKINCLGLRGLVIFFFKSLQKDVGTIMPMITTDMVPFIYPRNYYASR